ncbi:MAG: DUF1570 domain-containing protein [Phycisphaerae bacterium]
MFPELASARHCSAALLFVSTVCLSGCASSSRVDDLSLFDRRPIVTDVSDWEAYGLRGRAIQTQHFVLYSTLQDTVLEKAIPGFLENLYSRFHRLLPHEEPAWQDSLSIYVFANKAEWLHFVERQFPHRTDLALKIFLGGFAEGRKAVCFYLSRPSLLATIAHEAFHTYTHAVLDENLPTWLSEGMACYYESALPNGDHIVHDPEHNTVRRNILCESVQLGRTTSVATLVNATPAEYIDAENPLQAVTYYGQVWALVSYLRDAGPTSIQAGFKELVNDLVAGQFRSRVSGVALTDSDVAALPFGEQVLVAYFGKRAEDFEVEYKDYLLDVCGF